MNAIELKELKVLKRNRLFNIARVNTNFDGSSVTLDMYIHRSFHFFGVLGFCLCCEALKEYTQSPGDLQKKEGRDSPPYQISEGR